jgi:hypothetical protein
MCLNNRLRCSLFVGLTEGLMCHRFYFLVVKNRRLLIVELHLLDWCNNHLNPVNSLILGVSGHLFKLSCKCIAVIKRNCLVLQMCF